MPVPPRDTEGWGLLPGPSSSGQSSGRWQGDPAFLKSGPVIHQTPPRPPSAHPVRRVSLPDSVSVTGPLSHRLSPLPLSPRRHLFTPTAAVPRYLRLVCAACVSASSLVSLPLTSLPPVTISLPIRLPGFSQSPSQHCLSVSLSLSPSFCRGFLTVGRRVDAPGKGGAERVSEGEGGCVGGAGDSRKG